MSRIAIIGAGAWGTALAIVLGRKGQHSVQLWAFEREVVDSIATNRENSLYLAGLKLPPGVTATHDYAEALAGAEIVVSVMPSHHCRAVFQHIHPYLMPQTLLVSATKGIENTTHMRMTEIIQSVVEHAKGFSPRVGALSGPSFGQEVGRGDPTAITIASRDSELAQTIQREFSDPAFRVYTNDDVIGVELGGALKNVIAIAAGICSGLELGHNSVAALITRGLAEITRLAVACGGKPETLAGLAGVGDLVLTCTGSLSRNRMVGYELGKGRKLADVLAGLDGKVAEGVRTTRAAMGLARELGVEMPITEQMELILDHGKSSREALRDLMMRPGRDEED